MIELPRGIEPNDVHQWLDGGVFFARPTEDAEFKLAQMVAMPEYDVIRVRWLSTGERQDLPLDRVRCHWPRCGYINYNGLAVLVDRRQRRQYRRTYNSRCVTVEIPGKWQCMGKRKPEDLTVDQSNPEFLRALFYPEYPASLVEARSALSEGAAGVAVSPFVALVGEADAPGVFYRGVRVGNLVNQDFVAECDESTALRVRKLLGVNL